MPTAPKAHLLSETFRIELDGLPLADAAIRLTEALAEIPAESKASARFSVETEEDYGGCFYARTTVTYARPETPEEQEKRIGAANKQKANEIRMLEQRLALLKS